MKDRESNVHEELLPPQSGTESGDDGQGTGNQNRPAEREAGAPEFSAGAGDPRDQVVRLQAERDALFDRLARQQAEFENQRKRNAREQTEFRDYAIANTVKSLLPILDNFDLALKAGNTSE